jgi:hypothetical protein
VSAAVGTRECLFALETFAYAVKHLLIQLLAMTAAMNRPKSVRDAHFAPTTLALALKLCS